MRATLLRVLLLGGCVVAALAPADSPAQQPVLLDEPTQQQKLKNAKVLAQTSAMAKKGKFQVGEVLGVTDRPIDGVLAGTIPPPPDELRRRKALTKQVQAPVVGAPTDKSFNLIDKIGRDFPVQHQRDCGSCWIFAAVSAHEGNVLFKSRTAPINLSEQYILDCLFLQNGRDPCRGGWPDQPLQFLQDRGTFTRDRFPYAPENRAPRNPLAEAAPFRARAWGYVGGDALVPSVDELKRAINAYGSVVVAVYVGDGFQHYTGGIFGIGVPEGRVNHAVTLIGWDDDPPEFATDPALRQGTGGGVWVLRNSWGPTWGERGNMRIAYNSSDVGYGAMWVEAAVKEEPAPQPQPQPTPVVPKGYQKEILERIQFYEKNYPQYVPKAPVP